MTSTQSNVSGVVAAVQRDHREIEQLISSVEASSGNEQHAPESAGGNLVLGPIIAATDRVRDALRDAMRDEKR